MQAYLDHEATGRALLGGGVALWDWRLPAGEITVTPAWPVPLAGHLGSPIRLATWTRLVDPRDRQRFMAALRQVARRGRQTLRVEYRLGNAPGRERWVLDQGRVTARDRRGRPVRVSGAQVEISRYVAARVSRDRLLDNLRRQAERDFLTGLANRGCLENRLEAEWRRARRENRPLGLVLCDLDGFKAVNDTLGHQAGDDCLGRVGRALAGLVQRSGDVAARFGGDEFALLLPGADLAGARTMAGRARRAVADLGLRAGSRGLSLSAGAASLIPEAGLDPADLVARADADLYQGKGRCPREASPAAREWTANPETGYQGTMP